jgi:antitoxin component YwqK of YwqJK toxin-antitoxin module
MKTPASFWIMFLFSGLILAACSGQDSTVKEESYSEEVIVKRFDDSTKMIGIRYAKTDTNDQIRTYYYRNGNIYLQGRMVNNLREGQWFGYNEQGQKIASGYYEGGLEHGTKTTFFDNGTIRYQGEMVKGEKTGIWKFYTKDGELAKELDLTPVSEESDSLSQ